MIVRGLGHVGFDIDLSSGISVRKGCLSTAIRQASRRQSSGCRVDTRLTRRRVVTSVWTVLLSYTRPGRRFNSNFLAAYPRRGNVLVSGFSLFLRY